MTMVLRRCVKKAGWIARARTFRVELREDGLYILHLGPATGEFRPFRAASLEKAIAGAALDFFGNRYEKVHLEAEAELERVGAAAYVAKEHCALIPRDAKPTITMEDATGAVTLVHQKLKLTLFLSPSDYATMQEIRKQMLG